MTKNDDRRLDSPSFTFHIDSHIRSWIVLMFEGNLIRKYIPLELEHFPTIFLVHGQIFQQVKLKLIVKIAKKLNLEHVLNFVQNFKFFVWFLMCFIFPMCRIDRINNWIFSTFYSHFHSAIDSCLHYIQCPIFSRSRHRGKMFVLIIADIWLNSSTILIVYRLVQTKEINKEKFKV